jgi:hypothetical protein
VDNKGNKHSQPPIVKTMILSDGNPAGKYTKKQLLGFYRAEFALVRKHEAFSKAWKWTRT